MYNGDEDDILTQFHSQTRDKWQKHHPPNAPLKILMYRLCSLLLLFLVLQPLHVKTRGQAIFMPLDLSDTLVPVERLSTVKDFRTNSH